MVSFPGGINLAEPFDASKCFSYLESNRTVRETILARLKSQKSGRSVSVTDILNTRQAYWRKTHPEVSVDLERSADMMAGTGFHDAFNWKVSSEAWIEQKVNYQDINGRIDIYEKLPLELKTTKTLVEPNDLRRLRPTHLEQLGAYCGIVDRPDGWLLTYNRGDGRPLVGASVHFDLIKSIRKELLKRRNELRAALEAHDPSALPPCMWKGKGCPWEVVCDCVPGKVEYAIADLASVQPSPELEAEFTRRYKAAPKPQGNRFGINDLVYPRQAYYRSLQPDEGEEDDVAESLEALDSRGFMREMKYRALGVNGEYTAKPVQLGNVAGRVEFHEGRVLWVTRCGFKEPVTRYRLSSALGDRLLRLGFNAALVNTGRARLIVYYPNVPDEDARFIVYDLTFDNLTALRKEAERRAALLDAATKTKNPAELPACPIWRFKYCEFAPSCACGTN